MQYREFLRWIAFYEIETPGEGNENRQLARVAAALCTVMGTEQVKPTEFLTDRSERARRRRRRRLVASSDAREFEHFVAIHNAGERRKAANA